LLALTQNKEHYACSENTTTNLFLFFWPQTSMPNFIEISSF